MSSGSRPFDGIFISYRRQDSAYPAGWLYQQMQDRFGSHQIFQDVDNLEPGDDFVEKIDEAVSSCAVLLAVIGVQWLDIADPAGVRRLDDPRDFVRLEIEAALRRGVRVVPVLVGGATMPRSELLPESIAGLGHRQAVVLSPDRFRADTERLFAVLERNLADASGRALPEGKADTPLPERVIGLEGAATTTAASIAEVEPPPTGTPEAALQPTATPAAAPPKAAPREAAASDAIRLEAVPPEQESAAAFGAVTAGPSDSARPGPPARAGRAPAPAGGTPSGLPLWAAVSLVVAAVVLVVVNWPGLGEPQSECLDRVCAWKDTFESKWAAVRTWQDFFIGGPVLALAVALGAWRYRVLLGATIGVAGYVGCTASILLAGRMTYQSTGRWILTLLAAAFAVIAGLVGRRPDRTVRSGIWPAAGLLVLAGVGFDVAAQMVRMPGYQGNHTWLSVTDGFGLLRPLLLLAVAAPVLLDLGGPAARRTLRAVAGAALGCGLLDGLLYATNPTNQFGTSTVATLVGLEAAGLVVVAGGVVLAGARHDRGARARSTSPAGSS